MECLDPAGSLQITGDAGRDLAGPVHAGRRASGWETRGAGWVLQMAGTGDGQSRRTGGQRVLDPTTPLLSGSLGSPGCPGRSSCAELGAGRDGDAPSSTPHLGFGSSGAIPTMSPCHTAQPGPSARAPSWLQGRDWGGQGQMNSIKGLWVHFHAPEAQ